MAVVSGLWPRPDGGAGLVQKVHAIRKREGPDAGLGPVLPRVPQDLQTAATGLPTVFPNGVVLRIIIRSSTSASSNIINHNHKKTFLLQGPPPLHSKLQANPIIHKNILF